MGLFLTLILLFLFLLLTLTQNTNTIDSLYNKSILRGLQGRRRNVMNTLCVGINLLLMEQVRENR